MILFFTVREWNFSQCVDDCEKGTTASRACRPSAYETTSCVQRME